MPSVGAKYTGHLCHHNRSCTWNVGWKASMKGRAVGYIY